MAQGPGSLDPDIQRAIKDGRRNADGFALVKNWCAHVRIERYGGVGLIEQMAGVPIGHHGLACDHAPAGGMMCWDIRDAALDFHDRNCRNCALRKPVSIPNLGIWVAERDAELAKRQAANDADERERAARLASRHAERAALRAGLSPAAADVVDQIEELDVHRAPNLATRLVETARLANDAFPPAIIEYVFGLLERGERWLDEAGLQILSALNAEPKRLARCAMVCLQHWSATRTAAAVLLGRLSVADRALIPAMLPAIIRMASPLTPDILESYQVPKIATLVRLSAAFPGEVSAALDALLDGGPRDVGLAACAVEVLARRDRTLAVRLARALISKLTRAKWVPDPDHHGHDENATAAHDLRDAVVAAFRCDPEAIDALLQSFKAGASEAGEVHITNVYCRVLHGGRFRRVRPITTSDRIAFRRLLWEAPKTKSERILTAIAGAIGHEPHDLSELARDEVDPLLGAALLLDERITEYDAEPKSTNAGFLDLYRRTLVNLRNNCVSWAAAGVASAGDPAAYLKVLEGLPEGRDGFAACMIESAVALVDTAAGLNAILPSLYSALVGMSVARRGSAARAIGEMPWRQRENAPDLLFEAFVTTLTDPYIYVHSSAVAALGRFQLPDKFDARVRGAVWQVLVAHANDKHREDIVLECVELLVERYLTVEQRAGRIGAYLVALLAKMPPWRVSSHIRIFARELAHAAGLIDILVRHLLDPEVSEHAQEDILEALAELPVEVVREHRAKLAAIPVGEDRRARFRVLDVLQVLSRAGAWPEAEQLGAAAVAAIPDTAREWSVRLTFQLAHTAAAFEHALANSDEDRVMTLANQWREINATKEANDRDRARRPGTF